MVTKLYQFHTFPPFCQFYKKVLTRWTWWRHRNGNSEGLSPPIFFSKLGLCHTLSINLEKISCLPSFSTAANASQQPVLRRLFCFIHALVYAYHEKSTLFTIIVFSCCLLFHFFKDSSIRAYFPGCFFLISKLHLDKWKKWTILSNHYVINAASEACTFLLKKLNNC